MAVARGAVGVTINVGAAFAQCSSKCKYTSLAQSTKNSKALPVFGMPSSTEQNSSSSKGNNKRSRKQQSSPKFASVQGLNTHVERSLCLAECMQN